MKILIAHPQVAQARGAEKQVSNLVKSFKERGLDISILNFFSKTSSALKPLIRRVPRIINPNLPFLKYINSFYPPIILMKNYSKVSKKFDVINVHNYPSTWILKSAGKPSVWMCNEVPWNYPASNRVKFFFNLIQKIYRRLDHKIITKNVNQIVVLDKKRREDVKNYYGIDAKIIRSGVDTSIYFPLQKSEARKKIEKYSKEKISGKVVLFVSGLFKPKRLKDFLDALSLPSAEKLNLTALIVGEGPEEGLITSFNGGIKIIHLKNVPEDLMPSIYNASDVLVFPAINQPWGLVPFEAMACKCPTIVSKDTGASEMLTHLKNSILIESKNPEEILRWVKEIIENKELGEEIALRGYELVKKKLNKETYAKEMERVLKEVLKNPHQLNGR